MVARGMRWGKGGIEQALVELSLKTCGLVHDGIDVR